MEREREYQNSERERQLCSGDVGFVTWRSSSYSKWILTNTPCILFSTFDSVSIVYCSSLSMQFTVQKLYICCILYLIMRIWYVHFRASQ